MQNSKREQTALKVFSHLKAFQRVMMVKWVLELGARPHAAGRVSPLPAAQLYIGIFLT